MQTLEGEKEAVTELVRTIERDARHKGVLVLLRGTSEERFFFPIALLDLRDLTDHNAAKTPGYTNFMNTPLTDPEFTRDPDRCMKMLLLFKKNM